MAATRKEGQSLPGQAGAVTAVLTQPALWCPLGWSLRVYAEQVGFHALSRDGGWGRVGSLARLGSPLPSPGSSPAGGGLSESLQEGRGRLTVGEAGPAVLAQRVAPRAAAQCRTLGPG